MKHSLRSGISIGLVAILLADAAVPALAQKPAATLSPAPAAVQRTSPDSTLEMGILRGRAAADQHSTSGNLLGGFAWGIFLGLIGTGIAYAIASGSDTSVPPVEAVRLSLAPAPFAQGFQAGFSEQMKSKKKSSALTGGLLGTALFVVIYLSATSGQ